MATNIALRKRAKAASISHPFLNRLHEATLSDLINRTKLQSPERYNKRLNYSINDIGADFKDFISSDYIVAKAKIGDYISTCAFLGIMDDLIDIVRSNPKPYVNLQSVTRAVRRAIGEFHIQVDCTCPDFIYRYAYVATQGGYKYGKPETRPADIRNPDDNKGSMCKHLSAMLSNKNWIVKLATIVNNFIKLNQDRIMKAYDLKEDEFIINPDKWVYQWGEQPNRNPYSR